MKINKLRNIIKWVITEKLFFLTVLLFLIKAILFISIISTPSAASFDIKAAFIKIPFISVYIAFITVFLSFSFLFKYKGKLLFLMITDMAYTVLLIGDIWYYRGFGAFVSLQLLKMGANLDNMGDSILSMSRPIDFILVADIVIFFLALYLMRKKHKEVKRNRLAFGLSFILSVSYLVFMHIKVDIHHDTKVYQDLFKIRWQPDMTIANLSPLGYHVYDSYTFVVDSKKYSLSKKDVNTIGDWFKNKQENLPDNKYAAMLKGKNVIMLQVESLENFVIGKKVNDQEITPNINKLLMNSLYFSDFYEQVNGGTSSDDDLMVNTSIYPVRSGSTFFRYPKDNYNSLPRLFKEEGYTTMAIHPDKGAFWNWLAALSTMGFDKCYDYSNFQHDELIGLGLSDGSYLRQVEPIISKSKQPFYTFMITLTSHSPFDLPNQYRELKLDKTLDDSKLGGYFQSVHYTDKQIGIFLDKLKADGVLDNTVVFLYGDHTGIHKYYQDEVQKMKPSEDWWIDDEKKIPLLIYNPNVSGEEIKTNGGPIDIYPTACYLLGIENSKYNKNAMGRNLLNTKKDFAVLSDGKFIGNDLNYALKNNDIEGLDVADKIIRSDYFKK